jgi:hypothetical protein
MAVPTKTSLHQRLVILFTAVVMTFLFIKVIFF